MAIVMGQLRSINIFTLPNGSKTARSRGENINDEDRILIILFDERLPDILALHPMVLNKLHKLPIGLNLNQEKIG